MTVEKVENDPRNPAPSTVKVAGSWKPAKRIPNKKDEETLAIKVPVDLIHEREF